MGDEASFDADDSVEADGAMVCVSVQRGGKAADGGSRSTTEESLESACGESAALRSHHMRTLEPTEVSFCCSAAGRTAAEDCEASL